MTWTSALRLPLHTNLAPFVRMLAQQGLEHRVTEDNGEQVLWVSGAAQAGHVRELYEMFAQGRLAQYQSEVNAAHPVNREQQSFVEQLKRSPITAGVLIACLFVGLITQLGGDLEMVRWFTFNDFKIQGDYVYFAPLEYGLEQGQWWRLFSPMLLHFGFLHLAMNMLWYWEIGRRIEHQQGQIFLILLTLIAALVSNASQFVFSEASLFGGLSGVLYAVLGHCWIYQRIHPQFNYALPNGVVALMLIWLLLCLSGVVTALGFGQIANAAHVSGLVLGCVSGAVFALLARQRAA